MGIIFKEAHNMSNTKNLIIEMEKEHHKLEYNPFYDAYAPDELSPLELRFSQFGGEISVLLSY
jgi:hypothetical protein